ncbi:MAG: HEPN domain-containing protein [Deltaproteobacteria bacterium]|nr:HEPN domain-containing protein [Deltaproteobacteria bacterium]
MNVKKNDLNELLEMAEIGIPWDERGVPSKSLGLGEHSISIRGDENLIKFDKAVVAISKEHSEIRNGYTSVFLENKLLALLLEKKIDKKTFQLKELKKFVDELKNVPDVDYVVQREIFGISLQESEPPLVIGPFTIYNRRQYKEAMEANKLVSGYLMEFTSNHEFVIEYTVRAKEEPKAREVADDKFEDFIVFLWFLIGHPDYTYEIGILNYQGYRTRSAIVFSDQGFSPSREGYGSFTPLRLDDPYFKDHVNGFGIFGQLFEKKNPNRLERRIILAIKWMGQSIMDTSVQRSGQPIMGRSVQHAFIKAAIGLEVLLGPSRISDAKSKSKYIADRLRLILRLNEKEGSDLSKRFISLYEIRSAIAHSGKEEIELSDYAELLNLGREIVFRLLSFPFLQDCNTLEDVICQVHVFPESPSMLSRLIGKLGRLLRSQLSILKGFSV